MGLEAIAFVLDVVVTGLCAWLAARLRSVVIPPTQLLLILFITTAISLIPVIGYLVALAVFVYLLAELTDLELIDAIWTAVVAKLLAMTLLILAGVQWGDGPLHFLRFPSHMLGHLVAD